MELLAFGIFVFGIFYIYKMSKNEDTTPRYEDDEQIRYLNEWYAKKRAKARWRKDDFKRR